MHVRSKVTSAKMLSLVRFSRVLHRHAAGVAAMAGSGREFSTGGTHRAPIERVTVIGSGLMGAGIAQVSRTVEGGGA